MILLLSEEVAVKAVALAPQRLHPLLHAENPQILGVLSVGEQVDAVFQRFLRLCLLLPVVKGPAIHPQAEEEAQNGNDGGRRCQPEIQSGQQRKVDAEAQNIGRQCTQRVPDRLCRGAVAVGRLDSLAAEFQKLCGKQIGIGGY